MFLQTPLVQENYSLQSIVSTSKLGSKTRVRETINSSAVMLLDFKGEEIQMSMKSLDETKLQEFIGKVVNEWGASNRCSNHFCWR